MKIDFLIQNGEVSLEKVIKSEIEHGAKKMYIFATDLKESGFKIIEEHVIDTKVNLILTIGVDKKNTTKGLLENLLEYTKDIYVYDNNKDIELKTNIIIFEHAKSSNFYCLSGATSETALTLDLVTVVKVSYDLTNNDDKKEYKEKLKTLLSIRDVNFEKLDKKLITKLIDEKVIFSTKQYEHKVKSISEFLGKSKTDIKTSEKEQVKPTSSLEDVIVELPKIELNSFDFDIDITDAVIEEEKELHIMNEVNSKAKEIATIKLKEEYIASKEDKEELKEIEEDVEDSTFDSKEALDLDSLLFVKSNIELKQTKKTKKEDTLKKDVEDVITEDQVLKNKKIDLNSVTNYIFELPAKQVNEKDLDLIKVPNYIKDLIPNFFGFDKARAAKINDVEYKVRKVKLEIVDVKNDNTFTTDTSKLLQKKGQTFIAYQSEYFEKVRFEENDIARINKISENEYRIEIISKDLQEYKIWSKMINMKFKSVTRKYGLM